MYLGKGFGITSEFEKNQTSVQEESTITLRESSSPELGFCGKESEKTELFGEYLCGGFSSNFSEADPFTGETYTSSPTDGFTSQKAVRKLSLEGIKSGVLPNMDCKIISLNILS